jgi:chloride channel protein, CIC family
MVGLGAVAFMMALEWMARHVLDDLMGLFPPPTGEGTSHPIGSPAPWWIIVSIPTLGGLVSGLLVFTLAPEAEGHGSRRRPAP